MIKKQLSTTNKKTIKEIENNINKNNSIYLERKRKNTTLLNNINGYPLDNYQSNVVLSDELATLVVAGAGSGKSLTIIGKIAYLVKECNIKSEDILCISFTNDATKNLKHNIEKNYNFKINIYTFHKLALEILKQNDIEYQIAPEDFLSETIDYFFENIVPTNPLLKKSLRLVLGKKFTKKDLISLKKLILTFINLFKSNSYNINYFNIILKKIKRTFNIKKYLSNKHLLLLIINIYLLYEEKLKEEDALDFNDMINKSVKVLKEKGLKNKWKYIIVDEYQDTSLTKFNMLNEIIEVTQAKFLAVGDDFQSIYRFTGCDINIFLDFTKYFKYGKIFQIINTYRNPQELINVAGSFVMKNKKQQRKRLVSKKHSTKPIKIYYSKDRVEGLKFLINKIIDLECNDLLILGRNNKDITMYIDSDYKKLEDGYYTYNGYKFRYLTMHKSKGLESENVIIINMEDSLTGMPTKIKNEQLLSYVNKTKDYFPFEEERRLFYVALTRTKNNTFILSPLSNQSIFISEIKKYTKYVEIIKK